MDVTFHSQHEYVTKGMSVKCPILNFLHGYKFPTSNTIVRYLGSPPYSSDDQGHSLV